MEARLIHAHKVRTISSDTRVWRIINPLRFGIRVDVSQIHLWSRVWFNNVPPDVSHFLIDIAGEGGPWEGWTLYAVGPLLCTRDSSDTTPYFQVVFVSKETTAEQRVGQGSEMVGAKEQLKNEEFPVVQSAPIGSIHSGQM